MIQVSVITPTYNRAHLVREAIDSVLAQTFTEFELIVVDDGSTDGTPAVLAQITDDRVKVIRRENGGASAARNTGLAAAKGKWIAFLDSDDLFLPHRLELQMAQAEKAPNAGLIYGRYFATSHARPEKKLTGRCADKIKLEDLLMGPVFHWSTVLIQRKFLLEAGGFDTRFAVGEEWELTLRLILAGCQVSCVSEPLTIVRIQESSLSRDLHKHAASSMGVLEKTFNDPRMPESIKSLQSTSYAARLVKFAASGYISDDPTSGKPFLAQALEADPSLQSENFHILVTKLFGYLFGLSMLEPKEALLRMIPHLAGERPFQRKLARALLTRYYTNEAFLANRSGSLAQSRRYAIRAIWANPLNLKNRGLVSILLHALIGQRAQMHGDAT